MTTTYRVDVDGKTVWTETRDSYEGLGVFPAEYLNRPIDTPDDEAHPSPAHLYVDNSEAVAVDEDGNPVLDADGKTQPQGPVLIGIQRSHGHEADEIETTMAAAEGVAPVDAFIASIDVLEARAKSKDVLGDTDGAAKHRADRLELMLSTLREHPEYAQALTNQGRGF